MVPRLPNDIAWFLVSSWHDASERSASALKFYFKKGYLALIGAVNAVRPL
jgi:hypothetical protein